MGNPPVLPVLPLVQVAVATPAVPETPGAGRKPAGMSLPMA
jgi:hypothetical protein